MASFNFELVSPQEVAYSGEVDQVDAPGSEGDFGVLAGHAPLIALLRPGVLTVYAGGEQTKLVVLGGFAEVNPQGMTVLADFAAPVADVDRDLLAGQIKDLEEDVADASDGPARDRAAQRLNELKAVQAALGP